MSERPPLSPDQINTLTALEVDLNKELDELKKKVKVNTDQYTLQVFEQLEESVRQINEKAQRALQEGLQKASTISNVRMKTMNIDRVNKGYQDAVKLGMEALQAFKEEFSLS